MARVHVSLVITSVIVFIFQFQLQAMQLTETLKQRPLSPVQLLEQQEASQKVSIAIAEDIAPTYAEAELAKHRKITSCGIVTIGCLMVITAGRFCQYLYEQLVD